ncbi:hypothetical protein [Dyadobacter aurulentus]|uniref:hypothetical protein n=1 Tax=Dyadobacter sp. UC 10 TaxID=2605428 RepID=UPI0011F3E4C3|nr:hypothetical protein [Dyadobacter sp. UC 10]KAA0990050.1 hypothetical protein FXO21_07710 [Dyadobacter sp. UC 10]
MNHFNFEYSRIWVAVGLMLLGFGIAISIGLLLPDFGEFLGISITPIASFIIGFIFFLSNRKRWKGIGEATILENSVEITLNGKARIIPFESIKSFQVEYGNGTALDIWLLSEPKLSIFANENFCNVAPFNTFCDELEKTLILYGRANDLAPKRKPSLYESKWALPILMLVTVVYFGVLIRAGMQHKELKRSAIYGLFFISMFWTAWFAAWLKKSRLRKLN